ncbi:CHAT domain-containing tetratricopeptide repeat protein [Dokdonella ginsengisoli]|uniref:CHAT domain-containing protein n=1 Tax=Dokdonella ginsengisoli TaxID=363846 RepID=A0ABV9QWT8_9GAMM
MNAWARGVLLGAAFGVAADAHAAPVASPGPIEQALRTEDYARAEKLARAQLADAERRHGRDSAQALRAIDALVEVSLDGDWIETADLASSIDREIDLAAALNGKESREYARALSRKANLLRSRSETSASVPIVTQAAAIAARVLPADDLDRAEIELIAGSNLYFLQNQPAQGEALVAAAVQRLRQPPIARPRALARALRHVVRIHLNSQRPEDTLRAAREYEAYTRENFGAASARHGEAMNWLGFSLSESGQYALGLETLRESVTLLGKTRPYRQSLHVEALNNLAQRLGMLGDFSHSKTEYLRALAIEERKPTGNGASYGLLLNGLAVLHGRQGDWRTAATYLERALPVYVRVFGPDSRSVRLIQDNMASALLTTGRIDEAASILEDRVATYERDPAAISGKRPLQSYTNLAIARLWQRRYVEAEALYRRFLLLLGDGYDFQRINQRDAAGLAAALWGQGRLEEALAQIRTTRRSAARVRNTALDQLSERQMLAFDRGDDSDLAVAIAAASGNPALVEQAWQAVLETSGFVTQAMAKRIALASMQRTHADLWQEWRDTSAALSSARVGATKTPSAEAIAAVDRAQDALDRVERRLAGVDIAESRSLLAEQGDFAAAVADLPDDAALVRYLEVPDFAPDHYQRNPAAGNGHLYALVRGRAEPARAVDLGSMPQIKAEIDAWYAIASNPRAASSEAAAAKALRRRLLDPLALSEKRQRLFVIPSAALSRINFAALSNEDGRYLVETGPSFHLLNHERELLLPRPQARTNGLLLAGAATGSISTGVLGPQMRKACPGLGPGSLGALPGAASELAALQELAQDRAGKITVVSGAGATESAVRAAMPGNSIIHLATHAFAFGDHCADADALRSISLDLPQADGKPADLADLPNLSALAFLPDTRGAVADDGLLTSEEVTTLDLSGVDWVVLSACETALGKAQGGEGVFGLRRAFRLAGARTVVMSLWKVEDTATAQFMRELYRARLVERLDTPAAMQAAMRSTLEARRRRGESPHPLYWAGFVAAGAWR